MLVLHIVIFQPKIEELEQRIEEKDAEIEQTEQKKDSVMNEVFHDFCLRTNIKDIRLFVSLFESVI